MDNLLDKDMVGITIQLGRNYSTERAQFPLPNPIGKKRKIHRKYLEICIGFVRLQEP